MAQSIPKRAKIKYPEKIRASANSDKWIEEFWRLNKKTLTEQGKARIPTIHNENEAKQWFILSYKQNLSEDSVKLKIRSKKSKSREAVDSVLRMHGWGGAQQNMVDNLKSSIKYFGEEELKVSSYWKNLRNVTRNKRGQFTGIDWDSAQYKGDGIYTVRLKDGRILVIDFQESPKLIEFSVYDKGKFRKDVYLKNHR